MFFSQRRKGRKSCCLVVSLTCCPSPSAFAALRPLREESQTPIAKSQSKEKKITKRRIKKFQLTGTMCFTRRNTLFHEEKHFVSSRETFCFTKGNTSETLLAMSYEQ
ncbi:MAG: hypothetical protein UH542_07385 [Bacteroidales bacterium]|nr:hypothetical protein [Bacteroidales bacterium]